MKRFPPYSLRKSTKTKSKMSQLKNPVSDLDTLALRADEVVAALCQTSTQSHTSSQQQLINEIFDQQLNKIIEILQMPAARIQQPSSQYEFKPNAYSSRPTFNRKFKVTGPNNHTGPSKITDRITRIITNSKSFQKTCKFGMVGRRCRNETKHRPTVHYS